MPREKHRVGIDLRDLISVLGLGRHNISGSTLTVSDGEGNEIKLFLEEAYFEAKPNFQENNLTTQFSSVYLNR